MRRRPKVLIWAGLASAVVLLLSLAGLLLVALYRPLPLSIYRESVAGAFDAWLEPWRLTIEETSWKWDPAGPTVILIGEGLTLFDERGRLLATAPSAKARLPLGSFLTGALDPVEIELSRPEVAVTRAEDRAIQISLGSPETSPDRAVFSPGDLKALAGALSRCEDAPLPEVKVVDGAASYVDPVNAVHLLFADLDASVRREADAVKALMAFDLLVGDQRLDFALEARRDCDTAAVSVALIANEVNPAVLGEVLPGGRILYPFELPISGTVRLQLDRLGRLADLEFELAGGAGSLEVAAYTANNLYVQSLGIAGRYDPHVPRLEFDEAVIDLVEGDVRVEGAIEERQGVLLVALSAQLHGVDLSALVPRWFAGLHAALDGDLPGSTPPEETRLALEARVAPGREEIEASGTIELWGGAEQSALPAPSEGTPQRHLDFRLEGLLTAPQLLVREQEP